MNQNVYIVLCEYKLADIIKVVPAINANSI